MKLSQLSQQELTDLPIEQKFHIVHDGVARDNDTPLFDVAILLGGDLCVWDDRIAAAAKLWHEGRAKRIIITGSVIRDTPDMGPIIEAEGMANRLEKLGVPREVMLLDPYALTTEENMTYAATLIRRHIGFANVRRAAIVTSYSHMRRSLFFAEMFLPSFVKCTGIPSEEPQEYEPLCYQHKHYAYRIHEETRLLYILATTGQIPDIEF